MKKILIYTCAVDGAGDYHAALKTLPILLQDKTLQLTWIVKSQQDKIIKEILKARQQFPTVNIIHILPKHPGEMNSDSAQEIVSQLPTDTDLIIVLPNVNEMNVLQPFFSEHCKQAKILNISEYDYSPTRQPCHTMGLGKNSLGVLIPDTESKHPINPKQQENNGLNGFNMNEPFFFGYSNNTKTSQRDKQQLLSFIRSALMIAKKEGHKNVQIVTNIPLDTIRDSGLELEPLVRQIEYHSSTGDADPINYPSSTATTTLKIFNPFPLNPDEFQILLHRSHLVALCTGDQSLIENIFASKCIFYQVMNWKRGLSEAFAEFVKETCGPDSMYYHFVYKAIFHSSTLPDFLEKEWSSDPSIKEKIQSDAKKIADAIRQRKNFNNFLPSLVNLSLLSEEKLDTLTLQNINTSSQLLIILSAFNKNNSKILQVLQSMQTQLPGIINSFDAFKKILNTFITESESDSSMPVDSLSFAGKNVNQELLSILITAMQKNLPDSIREPQQLRELFSLPLTSEQRGQILGALHENLGSLIPSFYELEKLFQVSNGQLTSEHCRQILSALQANLGIWARDFYRLMDLFKLFNDQLTAEHCTLILTATQANLGTLITSCDQIKDLFKLSSEQLTSEHRTFILVALQEQLGTLITSFHKLKDLFKLSSEQLTSEHRTYILTVMQAQLGSLITFYDDLVCLFRLSNAQLTSEHCTLILSTLKERLGTLFTNANNLRSLFKLSNEQLTSEHRTLILGALQANFGNLFTSFYDLMDLFDLSNEQLTPNHRIQILESPALRSLLISLSDDEFAILIKFVPDEAIAKISTMRTKRKNDDLPPKNPSKFFKSSADFEVKQERIQKRSKQQGCQLM